MATIEDEPDPDDPRRLRGIFVSQVNYIRLAVLTIGELAKELYQRERQRARGVEPRLRRDLHYALERALTNVSLRNLTTALVIEEMFAGRTIDLCRLHRAMTPWPTTSDPERPKRWMPSMASTERSAA